MNKFNNLNTKTKLLVSFGAIQVLLLVVGLMSIAAVLQLNNRLESIFTINVVPLKQLGELQGRSQRMSSLVAWHILAHDSASMKQWAEEIKKLDEQIDQFEVDYPPIIQNDGERKMFERFHTAWAAYKEVRANALAKSADYSKDAASEIQSKELAEKLTAMLGAVGELVAENETQAKDNHESGQSLAWMLTIVQISLIVGALAIGALSSWAVTKFIVEGLGKVLEATKQLRNGNLAYRATVGTKEEIGQLAQAFNAMGEQLGQMVANQQQEIAAKVAEVKGITDAIGKSQAAIEFNLDGTIITANENFSRTMGYRLDEITGRHHRMFCAPAYTQSPEYQTLWAKLGRGEFDAGVYPRVRKDGKEIWIQASYNPILDPNGKVYKVVKFATDITAQKSAQVEMERLVAESQTVLGKLAANDLTQSMMGVYQGDLEKVKTSINDALGNLTRTITTVREAVEAVSTGSEEITKGNEDLSQRTSEQASALEETSASMEEMTSTVKQNADNAKQANQLAIAARDTADKGGAVTKKAVDAMGEINKSSKKIADIITVIDEIAFQTNLLALNAAVEAARAGEHGRGFAVVAAEVRNLAQRSAMAAKEIKGLINESIQRVTDGSELVNQSGKTLEEIVNAVKRVTDIIAEISAASQEQASGIDQVNKAIMSMDETTQQNAALVEETTSAAQSMKEQAKELMRQIEVFKVAQGAGVQGVIPKMRRDMPRLMSTPPAWEVGPATGPRARGKVTPQVGQRAGTKVVVGVAGRRQEHRNVSDEFEEF